MTERHVSQEKLAKVLGITVQALNAKLNGRSQFTLEEVVKISEHLKLDNPVDIFFNPSVSKMQQVFGSEEEVVTRANLTPTKIANGYAECDVRLVAGQKK